MEQKSWPNALTSLLIGALAALVVLLVLSLLMLWALGQPAQAAPDPATELQPTVYIPPAGTLPTVEVLVTLTPSPTPAVPTVTAGPQGVNVRSAPSEYASLLGTLDPGASALVTGRYADWWQIEYGGASGWVAGWVVSASNTAAVPQVVPPATPIPPVPSVIPPPAEPDQIDEERWIDIDLSEQTLTAYENGTEVRTTLISGGLPETPTPTGQFRVWIKFRYDDMSGDDYYIEDVPYVMYFYGGYALHGVTWHGNFGHPMSHGCVNLPTEEAGWLFKWADVGTLVNIQE